MKLIDYSDKEHTSALAKAFDLLGWPHHCRFTGRAKEDLIKLQLTNGELLDAMRKHLNARRTLYIELQTMSALQPISGYIFCPLLLEVRDIQIYCKFTMPKAALEKDEYLLINSAHKPDFPCPEEKR